MKKTLIYGLALLAALFAYFTACQNGTMPPKGPVIDGQPFTVNMADSSNYRLFYNGEFIAGKLDDELLHPDTAMITVYFKDDTPGSGELPKEDSLKALQEADGNPHLALVLGLMNATADTVQGAVYGAYMETDTATSDFALLCFFQTASGIRKFYAHLPRHFLKKDRMTLTIRDAGPHPCFVEVEGDANENFYFAYEIYQEK